MIYGWVLSNFEVLREKLSLIRYAFCLTGHLSLGPLNGLAGGVPQEGE